MTRLADIPPYTLADWTAEHIATPRLPCPNCGRTDLYQILKVQRDDGTWRHYRCCKVCGFWQNADGSPAFRCVKTVHTCNRPIPQDGQCANCLGGGPRGVHRCARALTTSEVGVFACKHCGVVTKSADVIPWPVSADSAPGPMLPCTNQPKEGSVATKTQLSGMRGVYLVAAELVGHGFIVSVTSRSAAGADLLIMTPDVRRAWSVQVKATVKPTVRAHARYFLLGREAPAGAVPEREAPRSARISLLGSSSNGG